MSRQVVFAWHGKRIVKKVFYPIFLVVLSYYDGWKGRIFAVGINDTGV